MPAFDLSHVVYGAHALNNYLTVQEQGHAPEDTLVWSPSEVKAHRLNKMLQRTTIMIRQDTIKLFRVPPGSLSQPTASGPPETSSPTS